MGPEGKQTLLVKVKYVKRIEELRNCKSDCLVKKKMANQTHFNVTPFNGTGFSNWEFRVKLVLEQAGVNNVLETPCPGPEAANDKANWLQNDVKARNIVVQCLADNMLEVIKEKKTAKEVMTALSNTYTKKGISSQVMLQKKLRSMKFTGDTALNVFLTEFEQTIYELKAAGGK